jgi:hypothetical protein
VIVPRTRRDYRRILRRHLLVIADHAKQILALGAAQGAAAFS